MPQRRALLWSTSVGAAAGVLVWVRDYEFFVNAGGPAAPISTAIARAFGVAEAAMPIVVFVPLVALIMIGVVAGSAVGEILRRMWGAIRNPKPASPRPPGLS